MQLKPIIVGLEPQDHFEVDLPPTALECSKHGRLTHTQSEMVGVTSVEKAAACVILASEIDCQLHSSVELVKRSHVPS